MTNPSEAAAGTAQPDFGMLTNAELHDRGPRYTETPRDPYSPDSPFIAEPWNALTASFFVVIAAAWLVRLRGRYLRFPFLLACLPILLAGGIGGTLYHGLRNNSFYFYLDVIPIQLLAVAGAVFIAIRLWHRHGWLYLGGAIGVYLGVGAILFNLVAPQRRNLAINLNYAALATMVVLPIAIQQIRTRFRHGSWIVAGVIAFAIAWFFRLWDEYAGRYLSQGSHWLWHSFGAISTALVIEFFYKVEGDAQEKSPGTDVPGHS